MSLDHERLRSTRDDAAVTCSKPGLSTDTRRINPYALGGMTQDMSARFNCALDLGNLGDHRAIPLLAQAYYAHRRTGDTGYIIDLQPTPVLVAIAVALSELGEAEELRDVLFRENGFVKESIVNVLKQIPNGRAVDCLIRALSHQDGRVRYWAARALGEMADTRAVEPLIALLQDSHIDTRTAAADSLGKLGDARALEALEHMRRIDHARSYWGVTGSEAAMRAIQQIQK